MLRNKIYIFFSYRTLLFHTCHNNRYHRDTSAARGYGPNHGTRVSNRRPNPSVSRKRLFFLFTWHESGARFRAPESTAAGRKRSERARAVDRVPIETQCPRDVRHDNNRACTRDQKKKNKK